MKDFQRDGTSVGIKGEFNQSAFVLETVTITH